MTNREKIDLCILSLLDHRDSTSAEIYAAVAGTPESGSFPHSADLVLKWLCEDGLCYERRGQPRQMFALTPEGKARLGTLMSAAQSEASEELSRRNWERSHPGVEFPGPVIADLNTAPTPAADDLGGCMLPPPGWECTRQAGHDGPCAAVPKRTLAESAAEFVRQNFPDATEATICNAQEVPAGDFREDDDEPQTTVCLTERGIDAWWDSLPIETKADVMANHYESAAAFSDRVLLTDAGRKAAAAGAIA